MNYIQVYHTKSHIHGIGTFTPVRLKRGYVIGVSHANYDGQWYMTTHGYYNHSKNPNCRIEDYNNLKIIIADRDIKKGEELPADYTKQSDLEQPEKDWK